MSDSERFRYQLLRYADEWEYTVRKLIFSDVVNPHQAHYMLSSAREAEDYFVACKESANALKEIADRLNSDSTIQVAKSIFKAQSDMALIVQSLQTALIDFEKSKSKRNEKLKAKHQYAFDVLWWCVYEFDAPITKKNQRAFLSKFEDDGRLSVNPANPGDAHFSPEVPSRETLGRWLHKINGQISDYRRIVRFTDEPSAIGFATGKSDAEIGEFLNLKEAETSTV